MRVLELVLVAAAVLAGAAYAAWRLWRAWSGRGCSDCAFTGGRDGACQGRAGSAECRGDGAAGTGDKEEKDRNRN